MAIQDKLTERSIRHPNPGTLILLRHRVQQLEQELADAKEALADCERHNEEFKTDFPEEK